jgi:hypothetical protein
MILEGSFDGMSALAALYLWLMFSYLSTLLNCDLQKILHENIYIKHVLGLIAFYFLFTVLDPNSNTSVGITFVKTIIVYILFMMITKSKWYFSLTAIGILLADQILKNHIVYLKKKDPSADVSRYEKARFVLEITMIVLIVIGYIHYYIIQKRDYKSDFSWLKFVFGTPRCKSV